MRLWLQRCWQGICPILLLLFPLTAIFHLISALRRIAYRLGWLGSVRLPVPVIVIGNITVGGTGKTPLTVHLAHVLRAAGWTPGLISRGYGGSQRNPTPVRPDSAPAHVGDEPVLLARLTGCPVWVASRRVEAGRQLLAFHPDVDVLLADDGLQHYALGRDIEIAVLDARRGLGNGWLLPVGPLREPASRLQRVDAVIFNGGVEDAAQDTPPRFAMRLAAGNFWNLAAPERQVDASHFDARPVHAVAGIGHPERFFTSLTALGLNILPAPFPDHHRFVATDLPAGEVIMTEKDAVKCADLARSRDDIWVLHVEAHVSAELTELILQRIGHPHGQQAA